MKHLAYSLSVVPKRLCFHRHLSFCSRGGGHALGQTPPSWQTPSPGQRSPGRHTHWADTPRADTPWADTPSPHGLCSGRYASYWNAFLLSFISLAVYSRRRINGKFHEYHIKARLLRCCFLERCVFPIVQRKPVLAANH